MPLLHWLGKDDALKIAKNVPYRVLEPDAAQSFGQGRENLIVQGDNLEALKALLPFYAGKIKCIYIDPPYNTKSAFEHYDDNLEHATWLSTLYPRLELLWEFLHPDEGSIWISIDDGEAHYLKVVLDELFGRKKFVASNVWQKRYSRENRTAIAEAHEYVYTYAKNPDLFKMIRNKLPLTEKQKKIYKNPNNDPRGLWRSVSLSAQGYRPNQMYEITLPSGRIVTPPAGSCWKVIGSEYQKLLDENRVYFGKNGNSMPSRIQFLKDIEGVVSWTWWPHEEVGHTDESKKEIQALFGADNAFDTPKPERLIARILQIATNEGDWVLDSFLGSGTTAAVAHKMKRRYIGIEMGEHATTHCVPRMRRVVEGEGGGISQSVGWSGGGGFAFYRLGGAVFDAFGRIEQGVSFKALAAHLWFMLTRTPYEGAADSPLLGVFEHKAYYLLYNGILGDRRPEGGNVLTSSVLAGLPAYEGERVIYGERSAFGPKRLERERIVFRQIPYDLHKR